MMSGGMLFAGDIQIDSLKREHQLLAALPNREDTDAHKRADEPNDSDDDPARKELLAEDIACTVERHGPEYEESEGEEYGHALGDLGGAKELGLFQGHCLFSGNSFTWHHFEIDISLCSEIVVVTLADSGHRLPVVFVDAENQGENRGEDERG